jgi:anti-sigma factor RsiW
VSCHDIKEMTVPYLELDLDPARVHEVTAHLESCVSCRNEMESVRQVLVLVKLKNQAVPDPGERFWQDFPEMVRRQLSPRLRRRRIWPVWPAALAAAVVLFIGLWLLMVGQSFEGFRAKGSSMPASETTSEASRSSSSEDLPNLTESDWDEAWDEDDPDMVLVGLAARLDPLTLDRLFQDI